MSFFGSLFKKIRKLQPLKLIGKAASGILGLAPAAAQVKQAEANIDARKSAGEAPGLAYLNGISDAFRQPLSGGADRTLGGLGIVLIVGLVIVLVVVLARRR